MAQSANEPVWQNQSGPEDDQDDDDRDDGVQPEAIPPGPGDPDLDL